MPETPAIRDQRRPFAEWLRVRMEASGYSTSGDRPGGQARLAIDTGLTASALSRALSGHTIPSPDALVRLAKALGVRPVEALRAAGFDALAEVLEAEAAPPSGALPDPILARIEHASELSAEHRAWLFGFYERRREQAMGALASEVEDIIGFIGSTSPGASPWTAKVRSAARSLKPAQREQLEAELRQRIAELDEQLDARIRAIRGEAA